MGWLDRLNFRSPITFNGSDRELRHYENQSLTIFDELFDRSFGIDNYGKDLVKLACNTEIVDTILIYLSSWFAMGEVIEKDRNGNIIDDGPLRQLMENPNGFQGKEEFLAEFYYYLLASGTNYVYPYSNSVGFSNDPEYVDLLNLNLDNIVFPKAHKSIFETDRDFYFKYREHVNHRREDTVISFSDIIPFYDSANGISGKYYLGKSRLSSIKEEIRSIRLATMAKQNKLDLSGITLVTPENVLADGGMSEGLDTTIMGTTVTQKEHIEGRFKAAGLTKGRSIIVSSRQLKSMNLTEHLAKLDFDKDRIEDFRIVKRKFGIPENLLSLTEKGATFDNQEKEQWGLLQTMVEPIANNLTSSLSKHFDTGTTVELGYKHLPAYTAAEKDRSESQERASNMVIALVNANLTTPDKGRSILIDKGLDL